MIYPFEETRKSVDLYKRKYGLGLSILELTIPINWVPKMGEAKATYLSSDFFPI